MGNVLITGGSRGMGRAVAIKFAKEGHNVGITYESNEKAAKETLQQLEATGRQAVALKMNLADPRDIDRAFAAFLGRFERLDYLFNNAGIFLGQKVLTDQTWEDWERILKVNVIGQWYCTKLAVENMAKNGGGAIVYNASISGIRAFPYASDYAASKHAVLGMVKGHAIECATQNIRVNGICPGLIRTDMYEEFYGAAEEYMTSTKIPARRIGDPEEIASLIYWLLVEGTYCYGESIVIDGGMTISTIPVPE
jgi:NAD(P)-dependent dehydrogenase (short-subunit alcohol dehydrogenase family)